MRNKEHLLFEALRKGYGDNWQILMMFNPGPMLGAYVKFMPLLAADWILLIKEKKPTEEFIKAMRVLMWEDQKDMIDEDMRSYWDYCFNESNNEETMEKIVAHFSSELNKSTATSPGSAPARRQR